MIKKRQGRYFIHIPGAGRLYPAPLPNHLFSIEDGCLHYDAWVEQYQPHVEVPGEDDEVEEQGGGPEQEEQPHNPYTTYDDIYSLGGTIDNMHNLAINLRDNTQNLSSHFAHWSSQWNFPLPQ